MYSKCYRAISILVVFLHFIARTFHGLVCFLFPLRTDSDGSPSCADSKNHAEGWCLLPLNKTAHPKLLVPLQTKRKQTERPNENHDKHCGASEIRARARNFEEMRGERARVFRRNRQNYRPLALWYFLQVLKVKITCSQTCFLFCRYFTREC